MKMKEKSVFCVNAGIMVALKLALMDKVFKVGHF